MYIYIYIIYIYICLYLHFTRRSSTSSHHPRPSQRPASRSWRVFACIRIIQASKRLDWAPWGIWPPWRTTARPLGMAWSGWAGCCWMKKCQKSWKVAKSMQKKMMQQWWRTTFFWEVLVFFRFLPSDSCHPLQRMNRCCQVILKAGAIDMESRRREVFKITGVGQSQWALKVAIAESECGAKVLLHFSN